jgi:NAD(P)-dependent dehydrogenase (short-subunit alcohol dehydrogenase family)
VSTNPLLRMVIGQKSLIELPAERSEQTVTTHGALQNKVALVTGAGSGIGEAIARTLAENGARVAVTDIDLMAAERVVGSITNAIALPLDVTSAIETERCVRDAETHLGPLDILINNAGVSTMNALWNLTERDWDFNMDVNAKGVFLMMRAALPRMMERRSGCIVNTASMAGKKAVPLLAHYAASKWACIGLTKSAAVELGPYGIRVNCVCPGYVATGMQERELEWEAGLRGLTVEQVKADYLRLTPLGRIETADDVARAVLMLCMPESGFITGAAIDVTGGANLT